MRNTLADIAGLLGFFTEDCDNQALFRRELPLALGRNFPDENIIAAHLGPDTDNAFLVQILKSILANIGNVAGHLLRS